MDNSGFRNRLQHELQARRNKNSRYSLRAFAALLGADHSTLSQILRGTRRVSISQTRDWARKLGIDREEAAAYLAAGQAMDDLAARRAEHLRHWAAEAMSIVNEPAHWEILRLCRTSAFRPDCRWIAIQIGVSVDQVNLALSRLLRLRLLEFSDAGKWREARSLRVAGEREFRELALSRVRQTAAEMMRSLSTCPTP